MKAGLKIIHWIFFLWFLAALLRFQLAGDYLFLIIKYCGLLITDFSSASTILSFSLIDAFVSVIFFLLIIPLILIFKKRLLLLYSKLNFTFAFLFLLGFVFLFAPIITNENPEFSKNLSVTKLLPPFSIVRQIQLPDETESGSSSVNKFRKKLNQVIKQSFNDNIIFADSVIISNKVIYYQKGSVFEIDNIQLLSKEEKPFVKDRLFILGTDEFGRDMFTRLIYGTRISIAVGLGAVALSFIIGIILGFIAGYSGGFIDTLLNRFTEIFLAFPLIYLVILILALFGNSFFTVVVVLGISGWMSLFKIVKSEVLSIKLKDYFSTAELIGLSKLNILSKEILPVIMAPVLVNLVFLFSNVVLAEAALSYLGLGTGNQYPSWGSMISSGQEYITKAWWLIAFPGLFLILTLFSFNSAGKLLGKILNPKIKV